jgi:PASTA domain-containing protein
MRPPRPVLRIRHVIAVIGLLSVACTPEPVKLATTEPSPPAGRPSPAVVPDLVGTTYEVALSAADANGWELVTFEQPSKERQGTVLSQDPVGGVVLATGRTLTITIAVGKGAPPTEPPSPSSSPTDLPGPPPPPGPGSGSGSFGDGTYRVGSEIGPGTYRTRSGSSGCYWERLSGFGGSLDEIIANEITDFPTVATIDRADEGFSSSDCGSWSSDLSRVSASMTTIDQGMWIVGTDVSAGSYRTTGGDSCYWERLRGFGGELNDVIANDLPSGSAIVTISTNDAGFSTNGCGPWNRT